MTRHAVACPDCMGTLDVDSIPFSNAPAWCAYTLDDLWSTPPARGTNVILPGVAGRVARRFHDDEHAVSLPMVFGGDYDVDGLPTADRQEGLQANLEYFHDAVIASPGTVGDVRTAEFVKPDGTVLTEPVQVRGWQVQFRGAPSAFVVVRLVFPGGRLGTGGS